MKVMILGGDGFCGWPTALHLSERGHRILIVDNFSRRRIDDELGVQSLTPIKTLPERLSVWLEVSGKSISFTEIDVARQYEALLAALKNFEPDAIIHFAEQRAAPYSMKSPHHKRYTVSNNTEATHNLLAAIVESRLDAHLIHLGTMGVYGYTSDIKIPEGYLTVRYSDLSGEETSRDILFPADPGSVYHMTKTMDQLQFLFYNKNDGVRITDLHQGIVWGTQTAETKLDEGLVNRFDYDGDYGTALNRFIVQAVVNHPLTVHGRGGQTRAFIHIQDSVKCIELALLNPPKANERVRIFNQATEVFKINDLAKIVAEMTGARIEHVPNPRNELEENELHVDTGAFLELGLEPTCLRDDLLSEIMSVAIRFKDRVNTQSIPSTSKWLLDTEVLARPE